ncbi:hypothetical protein AAZX31_04G207000 [Glycine max]|uniref:Uncharacterized protein n=2 Tax=Glycine subgen. Soja TaxID=1462606 RepID=K7KLR8_SOYBN|nr:hypothetical protein JHK87_010931 [Glycine soja]KAG5050270.1 hypothetical protein JHK85_011373 [Glycine max]KAG5067327.1 hypothetical protein JHK86_011058 [Glycine max]KAH1112697.1 hypothetical protein GYH30_010786 [Glycine max]KAH1255547.1 hypothetical protein GmHk_04G011677 [Glycine max]
MGGCVSAPKEVALNEGELAPVAETVVAQENTQEEGDKKEEPLVELTEAKEEKVEAKAEEAETKEPEKEEVNAEDKKSEEPLVTL